MPTDDEGELATPSGTPIPDLALEKGMFLDRTTVVYGASGNGKTTVTKEVMWLLRHSIDQVVVIATTENDKPSYSGFVPPQLIHTRLYLPDPAGAKKDDGKKGAIRFLETLWERQSMACDVFQRANNPAHLAALFARLPPAAQAAGLRVVEQVNGRRLKLLGQLRRRAPTPAAAEAKKKQINDQFREMLRAFYKRSIAPHFAALWGRKGLSEEERYCLQYLEFNPRLLLIFDDCAAELKPLFNHEMFRKIFYQGRHKKITTVLMCQDDTDLPAALRKNAFVSFFLDAATFVGNFERPSNQFSKAAKATAAEIAPVVFARRYHGVAFLRDDPTRVQFYHVHAAERAPFLFGSDAVRELCAAVQATETTVDRENPFYATFRV